jgi:yecA family protein
MQNPSYHDIDDVVYNSGGAVSAAEAHGMLAGMLCASKGVEAEDWLTQVLGTGLGELNDTDEAAMDALYADTQTLLKAVDFSFELFLPEDDISLTERVRALSEWCQGFLYGIGYAGSQHPWPVDCAEVLRDLSDISLLDENAEGEDDEAAYAEIREYVRVSVQLIHGDMHLPPRKATFIN